MATKQEIEKQERLNQERMMRLHGWALSSSHGCDLEAVLRYYAEYEQVAEVSNGHWGQEEADLRKEIIDLFTSKCKCSLREYREG